jgi:cyclophilin family peptidyl-prolyl cis-trans isomerase
MMVTLMRPILLATVGAAAAAALSQTPLSPAERNLLLDPGNPAFTQPAPARSVVRFETSKGDIDIAITRDWSPLGADRFVSLVRHRYYDGTRFFRVTTGRWIQFGINGDPAIAQAWRTRTIADDPFRRSNIRGTVAFAFAVPNGRTTQVFFNLRDNSATHDKEPFTPFGMVTAGLDVLDAINPEYGEGPGGIRAGRQDPYFAGGNAWLLKEFPRLDLIRRATILERQRGEGRREKAEGRSEERASERQLPIDGR